MITNDGGVFPCNTYSTSNFQSNLDNKPNHLYVHLNKFPNI